ncbi:hypothetical protein ACMYYO_05970 [Dermacoccaceae bacterium W4C1]
MKRNRRASVLAVPAVAAALVLSACQEAAPDVAAPSVPGQSSGVTPTQQSGDPAEQTTESQPSQTQESQPTQTQESQSSESSSSSTEPDTSVPSGTECRNPSSFALTRGTVEAKPLNEKQTGSGRTAGNDVEITFGTPTLDTSSGSSSFPGDGMQTVIYPITMKATGSYWIASYLKFGLVDAKGNGCRADVLNAVISGSDKVSVKSLREGDTFTGKLAYAIPAGADLNDYTLVYKEDYPGAADLAWKAK